MQDTNIIFGITNIASGILFILISIPLVMKKIPMNRLYGFRIQKAFSSDDNWYNINQYGGRQMILWSMPLIVIGLSYFIFPIQENPNEMMNALYAVGPMVICVTVAIVKTMIYSKSL